MAAKYFIGGGTNQNWNSSPLTNWSATSGGIIRVAAPTSIDDVIFDGVGASANSNNTISATITVLSITYTSGFTATTTHNAVATIAGNWTFGTFYTIAGSSAVTISAASTITSGGKTWPNNLNFSGANTKILNGDLTIGGQLIIGGSAATVFNRTASENCYCNGISYASTITGNVDLYITGGTSIQLAAILNLNTFFQGSSTISTNFNFGTSTITYISGTITTTGSLLTLSSSCTLNTAGIIWNNITIPVAATITNNSFLTATGTLNCSLTNGNYTFAGTSGFSVAGLTCGQTSATTVSFKNSLTYTITSAFNAFSSRAGGILLFTSDHATLKANLIVSPGATCNILASFTRIDASGGRPTPTFNGTITDCLNISELHDFRTVGF